jgi:GGDEF domain-containing protein
MCMTRTTTEKLAAALESKTNIALILGVMDSCLTIREMFGLVSCDAPLQSIEQMLHERFGDCSVRIGDAFLILLTGNRATKALEIAESIRGGRGADQPYPGRTFPRHDALRDYSCVIPADEGKWLHRNAPISR